MFVKGKGINGKVAMSVEAGVYSAREYVKNVDQNMSNAYFAMEQVKERIVVCYDRFQTNKTHYE